MDELEAIKGDFLPVVRVTITWPKGNALRLVYEASPDAVIEHEAWADASKSGILPIPDGWRLLIPAAEVVGPEALAWAREVAVAEVRRMVTQAKVDLGLESGQDYPSSN